MQEIIAIMASVVFCIIMLTGAMILFWGILLIIHEIIPVVKDIKSMLK